MNLLLASKSPRRRDLLTDAGYDFEIVSSPFDEKEVDLTSNPVQGVCDIACGKAAAAFDTLSDEKKCEAVVLGADTIVVCDGEVLLKPKDEADAAATLRKLSGKRHQVHTAVSIISATERETFVSTTDVYFYELTDAEISAYIETSEPMDKAGSYGIQGKGGLLVEKIDGDYYNVVGLPIARTVRALQKYNLK